MTRAAYAWIAVALLWVTAALNYVDRQVIYSVFPLISRELSLSGLQLGFLASAFLWVYGVLSPVGGYLSDRIGAKRVILISLGVWSTVTFLTSQVSGYYQLVGTRLAMGISEAFYLPAALALIAGLHTESTRARAVGLHQSGLYGGIVLGGWGGAWIGAHYGWRAAFLFLGIAGVIYAIPLVLMLRAAPAAGNEPRREVQSFTSASATVLGSPVFLIVLFANGLTSAAYWCVYTWLPLFLFERFKMSLADAGFSATFYIQVASLGGVVVGGWLADRWVSRTPGARFLTQSIGLAAAAPALFITAITGSRVPLIAALLLFGLGRGFFDCNLMPVVCRILPEGVRATAYGFLNLVACVFGGFAALAGGALRETLGLGHALELSAAMLLIAAIIMAALGRARIPAPVTATQ